MAKRRGTTIRTKKYERFRGVDFSTDPALVDDARSPWAPNMVADNGGMPEKRPGWRIVKQFESVAVNGIFNVEFDGVKHLIAHVGTKLYRWYEDDTASVELRNDLPNRRSTAVYMGGYLWIFTGEKLLRYNGTTAGRVSDSAYVPLTIIARAPSGGGEVYEAVNLMSGKQKIGVLGDGTSKDYILPYTDVTSVDLVEVNGVTQVAGTDYTVNLTTGKVTFVTAPPAPSLGAEDNVFITFTKVIQGYNDKIDKCTNAIVWGIGGSSDRIIATGNSDYQNQDFISGFSDGTYWPDLNYATVGTEETAIVGYRRLGEYLAIIKEDNGQDSTIFLRNGSINDEGEAVFSVKPCISGAGAVTRFGFGNIDDEQLILTGAGVYALTTNSLTAERIVQNRSFRIDPKLMAEDLTDAVSCNFDNCYLIFVNDKVYGLDGKQQKSYPSRNDTSFLYECFYWENIPAHSVMRLMEGGNEYLYFGSLDGCICKFNTDIDGMDRYNDNGHAIEAIWSTKADDDGDPMVYKTMLKKGNAVTIKPYARSSAKVCFRTDKDPIAWQAAFGTMDIFDWEDIDFSRFTFNANDGPAEIPFNRKIKNYKRLQIVIKNDALNEGFGVYCIVKHFVTGNFAKK